MFAAHRQERSAEMSPTARGNGYVEIDPTGRYGRFDQLLGKGATKTVYRAFDEVNGIEVAWNQANLRSVLQSPATLQRMYSEVHLLSSLRHESIIGFHTSWVNAEKRTLNFITEMFTSGTLREYRKMYPRVDVRAIKRWSRQILDGLAYLHGHDPPVIHRDIKCDNIFVNGHLGQVKIGDLGLAALLRGSQSAHSVIGTPEFMAPELYEEDYNELADIYSFGMCVLEMLTSEYPYSECSNPAQIYKKVTSGKLPDAFRRIEDGEARRFIRRCLEKVGKRSSAKELLLDPFLELDDRRVHTVQRTDMTITGKMNAQGDRCLEKVGKRSSAKELLLDHFLELDDRRVHTVQRTDMTITGKMNAQGDTIFLRVQIVDKNGQARNIYFPFDVACDTPTEVADEMVKELEIADREPSEIAEMIGREISILVPDWRAAGGASDLHYVYDYVYDAKDGGRHPLWSVSPLDSSQGSVLGQQQQHQRRHLQRKGSFQGCLFSDDDEMNFNHSGKHSSMNSASVNAKETHSSTVSSRNQGQLYPGEDPERDSPLRKETERPLASRYLMRNRSMIDMRSHLLHRNLVEHLQKRLFNTVGSVEQIGLQNPCNGSQYKASSSPSNGGCRKMEKQLHSRGRRQKAEQ